MNNILNGKKGAIFSECGYYRYALWRRWDETKRTVLFVMLNPSIADAKIDDNTIRKCKHYANSWGFGSLLVGNLFAWRATKPAKLKADGAACEDIVGPCNDRALEVMVKRSAKVIAAWGNDGSLKERSKKVRSKLMDQAALLLHALEINKTGEPRHPLYVRRDLRCDDLIPESCWKHRAARQERRKDA